MKKEIKTGSDFSGVGAFDYAMQRVSKEKGFKHKRVYACDWDKFARITYVHNHGKPEYYPHDVYEREIPKESLDIYMTSPPCQAFSIAGKRKGKEDERGILFFNSHKFIKINKPRFFIFENVKGLLSDDNGRTFGEWIRMLGGKSVNGLPILFADEESVPYHIYWKVLNSKNHGVPQNRERVFIVGIRDDEDNNFTWSKEEHLTKRLKDVLESEVDEKYFLSEKMVNSLLKKNTEDNGFTFNPKENNSIGNCVTARCFKMGADDNYLKVKSATKRAQIIQLNESKESGGKQPYQQNRIYDTQGITPDRPNKRQNGRRFKEDGDPSFTLTAQDKHGVFDGYRIRRLTPRECFRLQDFPEEFDFSVVSDSQAYKQAGNSITVRVLQKIILKLNL